MEQHNETRAIIDRAKAQLAEFYNGNSWVTDNFHDRVFGMKDDEALQKVPGHHHTVAQLTAHITAWRNFALQKIAGHDGYDILEESSDWPVAHDWNAVCDDFKTCHINLLSAIENFPLDRWESRVPGRNYSFLYLIHGIIQHDYYHYGQIGSVIAGIKELRAKV